MNTMGIAGWAAYMLLFVITNFAVIWLDHRRRRTRKPFPENLKLLRMPGEFLWRRVVKSDEEEIQWWFAAMLLPLLVAGVALFIIEKYLRSHPNVGLVGAVMAFAFSVLLCAKWAQIRWQRRSDDYLGFFGERCVGECLEPLKSEGWFIFHDIQCAGATGKFNLDHVAVGPGGVWIVETKTRRKGRARPGFKEHEVFFDGTQIIWPWGEDKRALGQATKNARWLCEWIETMTGKVVEVASVIALPGYCVIERKLGPVRVANPKVLSAVLASRGNNRLAAAEIDIIRRQLDEKCRDVEY